MRWLLLMHGSGGHDHLVLRRDLRRLSGALPESAQVWVLLFGPTRRSTAVSFRLTRGHFEPVETAEVPLTADRAPRYAVAVERLLRRIPPSSVDAVGVSAHASGWVTGPWKGRHPFLTLSEINALLLDRYRPRLVVFDACMMGTMAALYGLSDHVRVAVASPALQPYFSPFRTQAFARSAAPGVPATLAEQKRVARAIVAEWQHHAAFYGQRCMLAFDVRRVKRVAGLVLDNWMQLQFDKRAQLHKKDANLFDLWTAARNLPALQRALERCVLAHKPVHRSPTGSKRCCFACKRVRSVSVEARTPGKWQHIYKQNPWARMVKRLAPRHPQRRPRPAPPHPHPLVPRNLSPRREHVH